MAQCGKASIKNFIGIPVSIVLGVILGCLVGFLLYFIFENAYAHNRKKRGSMKVIIILTAAFLLIGIETWVKKYLSISGLLAVVAMACVLKIKCDNCVSIRLSEKFGKLWLAAEVLLFALVGAAVDIRYTLGAGIAAVGMIFAALLFRSVGVMLCLVKTPLNRKERIFCILSYLPKATVQAAIGSVPLALGLPCGKTVLSVAVLGILITAPLGAFAIDFSKNKLLNK